MRKSLILDYESMEGVRAFSECATFDDPYYLSEDNSTAVHIITAFLAKELKTEVPTPEEFIKQTSPIRGHNMAKGAIEMLLWDFHCKLENKPLAQMLGDSRGYASVGISLGIEKPELLLKKVEAAVARGYKRIKLKIKPGSDYNLIKFIRNSYPDIDLSVDANGTYTLKDLNGLKRLDEFDLLYVEQPLEYDDIIDHAELAKQIYTPICLDESITTPKIAKQALEMGAAKIVNIKPGRLGGLASSLEVARIVKKNGGSAWVGGMLETGVGRSFNNALASLKLMDLPGDTSPNDEYFAKDIVKNPFTMRNNGTIRTNTGPGIGVEIDEGFLASFPELKVF